jgi:metal-responsive CopG/Arc/MetJ family transcriptional regulator
MKIGVSLPNRLIEFANETAERRGTTRSGLFAQLLEAEMVREQVRHYLDRYGWDIAEDEASWRKYRRRRMAGDYAADDW